MLNAKLWVHQPSNEDSIIPRMVTKVKALSFSANLRLAKAKKGDLQDKTCFEKCGEKGHYATNFPKASTNWKHLLPGGIS